jgi:predicted RNA-binding Zn ribbon-like protein
MVIDRSLPWLVFPPAVDLANTVVTTSGRPIDLLATEEELDVWVAAERGRIPHVESARGRLGEVRGLRQAVHALLHARASRRPPPQAVVDAVNAASRAVPIAPVIDRDLAVRAEPAVASPFEGFCAAVARSAIELFGSNEGTLAECAAPRCGMLFLPTTARQTWCSPTCGNRARVARHAARRRASNPPSRQP